MDIAAVERIRPMGQAGARSSGVAPTLGVNGVTRMEEDSYQRGKDQQDRGMDEEAENDDQEEPEGSSEADQTGRVSLFA